MGWDDSDYQWDELWDQMSKEVYPDHKLQAIDEFTTERLQSYYVKNPDILAPGIWMYGESRELQENHPSASFVFATSAIEIFLKAALLKPVVYGLVHNEALAEIIVKTALNQSGFKRYLKQLSGLFSELLSIEIESIKAFGSDRTLLAEASEVQDKRNEIIHQGKSVNTTDAKFAIKVAYEVLHKIVNPMLLGIGLWMNKDGIVLEREEGKKVF